VEIEVSDTGAGISPEFLPFVFDRFRQADMSSTRAHGGLGLGLGIARHLVELHGGTIQAASKGLGRGATFTIRLPLATTQSQSSLVQNTDAAKVTNQNRDATRVLKGLRVLVVDDEIDIREMLTLMLRNNGAEVIAVASGREALDELKRAQPDVLMCDIGMPEMDGYSLIGKVRSLPFGDTIPAIALTAYAKEEDRSRALASGFQVHAPKPVDPEKLISLIASLAFNN
jgi:CheY-like chemotaxis protein